MDEPRIECYQPAVEQEPNGPQAARMREALSAMDGFRKALQRTAAEQLAAANALAGLLVLIAAANRKEGETDA